VGKARIFWLSENPQVAIFSTGAIVHNALKAAKELESENIFVKVLNIATIKPLDTEAVIDSAKECEAVVTVEEHQKAGGMGSAIAECLAQSSPVPIEFVGVSDVFGQSGKPEELIEHYGMGVSHIKEAVKKVILRK